MQKVEFEEKALKLMQTLEVILLVIKKIMCILCSVCWHLKCVFIWFQAMSSFPLSFSLSLGISSHNGFMLGCKKSHVVKGLRIKIVFNLDFYLGLL